MVSSPWDRTPFPCIINSPAIDGTTVYDALEKGLDDLMELCDVVETKFTTARDDRAAQMET